MTIGLLAFLGTPLPVVLWLFGVLPENGAVFMVRTSYLKRFSRRISKGFVAAAISLWHR